MPRSVVVCEGAANVSKDVRLDGLIENDPQLSVVIDPEFPRTTPAALDSTVVRRRIRCPPEPPGDREVRGRYGNRERRDPISRVEVPRPTDLAGDVGRACDRPVITMPREIPHLPICGKRLHVVS